MTGDVGFDVFLREMDMIYSEVLNLNTLLVGVFFLLVLLYLLRNGEMKAGYVIFWFSVAVGVMLLLVSERVLYFLVALVGAQTPSAAILFFAVMALFLLNIHYSAKISRLENLTTQLVQEIGLLFCIAGTTREAMADDESSAD